MGAHCCRALQEGGFIPEVPKQEVTYSLVGQGSLQQETGQVAIQVGFILQNLNQLQEVLKEFIITVEKKNTHEM